MIVGIIKYGFDEKALEKVVQNLARAQRVPSGYLYPELLEQARPIVDKK